MFNRKEYYESHKELWRKSYLKHKEENAPWLV